MNREESRPGELRTVSLRRRVTLTVLAVLGMALIGVVFVVQALFAVTTNKTVNAILADRAQLAQQLANQNVGAAMLIRRVDARSVRAELVLADGQRLGSLVDRRPSGDQSRTRRVRLTSRGELDGAVLTLEADAGLLSGAGTTLLRVLLFTALGALVLTAAALVVTVRFALAPLDAMTRLARSIARGHRGRRLSPTRADTELGRTARAFDEMLDALEGAEWQARAAEAASRASEERTRRFVADAAHELRTPIAGVQAVAEAVLQQAPDADQEERERLHLLLVRESRRAGQLVDDLLDLARIDAGVELQREPVELRALAEAQAARARLQHPGLTIEVDGAELVVVADPARLTQILANVVDNACQATPKGGRVQVLVGRSVEVAEVAEVAEVIVTDTGPGVSPADRERIFDRLTRLDEARDRRAGGSGLGLAIARGFARAHGGELTCDPPPPGTSGAVFRLVLPIPPP